MDHVMEDAGSDDRNLGEILRPVFDGRSQRTVPGEGLRDRKKRLLRELISDTATSMFLERGFDEVRVSEIAEACEVSEKTVYNYFPTKESLLFDREEDMARQIRAALSDPGARSLADASLAILEDDVNRTYDAWADSDHPEEVIGMIERFATLIETTPSLTGAQYGMMERLNEVAATALAERAGLDPEDPEPQMAAAIVIGIWRAMFTSMRRHSREGAGLEDTRTAVLEDLRRSARLADAGLTSFNLVIGGARTSDQFREAAEATNEARKQMMVAVKQARNAWKQVMADMQTPPESDWKNLSKADLRRAQQEMRDEIRRRQGEIRRAQHEIRQQAAEMRRANRRPGTP